MASTPSFAATPLVGSAIAHATLDTSLTAPTNYAVCIANLATGVPGGANRSAVNTKVEEIVLQGLGTTAAGVVNLFVHDGTTHHLFDQVLVAVVTSSTTAVAWRAVRQYANLFIPAGSSLRFSQTISGNQSMIKVSAFGGDL